MLGDLWRALTQLFLPWASYIHTSIHSYIHTFETGLNLWTSVVSVHPQKEIKIRERRSLRQTERSPSQKWAVTGNVDFFFSTLNRELIILKITL